MQRKQQNKELKKAFDKPAMYASGLGDIPSPPPLPVFVTNPSDTSKYIRVSELLHGTSQPFNITGKKNAVTSRNEEEEECKQYGSSCPSSIDSSKRLLSMLKSPNAANPQAINTQTNTNAPTKDPNELTKHVKKLLNIDQ